MRIVQPLLWFVCCAKSIFAQAILDDAGIQAPARVEPISTMNKHDEQARDSTRPLDAGEGWIQPVSLSPVGALETRCSCVRHRQFQVQLIRFVSESRRMG